MVGNRHPTIQLECVTILLVEDNVAEARFLQEVLKGSRFNRLHLTHVKRLAEAITLLETSANSPPDVILLDLTLPDSTGLASLDLLIRQAPSLPIVVLTNTNDEELAVEAVRHGAQDYLIKRQINQEVLVRSLRYAIERKQAAEALREANEILELRVQARTVELETANQLLKQEIAWREQIQERLTLAQQAGKIGTFEWQIQSDHITWTVELEALYGLAPGSFEGSYAAWMQTLHPDDRPNVEQELWQTVEQGRGLDIEFRIFNPSGEVRWIAVKSSLFHNPVDQSTRLIGIHMDITEKKQLEAQFLRAQRLESLGTLASGIAHDLNNILTPILAGVQLLPLRLPQIDDQSQRMLTMMEASAKRGAELIKQILSFARGVEGKRVSLQINHLIVEIRRIIQQTLPKSIEIETDLSHDLWTVSGDATQLHQVLMNLCVNARDAMPQGGTLQITAENRLLDQQDARIHIDARAGAYVIVTVADTGIGMAPDVLHRIFDPFFTTKEIGQGTGLGLSAVLGIVKSHGGFVDVRSEVNQGSQFKVYLPASQSSAMPPEQEQMPSKGQQELILVVDDEVAICDIIRLTLETHDYQVIVATDGIEAIARFAEHKDQLCGVLLDMMMPSLDGLTTITVLRQLNPTVPIIAISGLNSTEIVAQTERMGLQGFLPKPFTTQELLQTLVVLLRNR